MILSDSQILNRRDEILDEMRAIRQLIAGKLSSQFIKKAKADGSFSILGPYFIYQRWKDGKNRPERINKEELPAIQAAVAGFEKFKQLTAEFAEITEILTERRGTLLPSKKNSKKKSVMKNSPKRKPSSKGL